MQLHQGATLQNGKYNIEQLLGQGGFGITYLATRRVIIKDDLGEITTDVKVAIKEFFMKELCNRDQNTSHVSVPSVGSKELVEKFRKKFMKEANNIATLKHPNIIKVLEVFEENGTAYYVMEYVDGVSLNELVTQRGALTETDAIKYIKQAASALDYIHQKRVNHLDVKPANILLKKSGDIVLIDFGLAKQYDAVGEQTSSTPLGVSVGYAPIEQSTPGGVSQFSAPTDIYALGATLYKLLTGETPPSASEVMNEGLPFLPKIVSKQVITAIQKSMEPGRKNRPQSVSEFLEVLEGKEEERKAVENVEDVDRTKVREEVVQGQTKHAKKKREEKTEEKMLVGFIIVLSITAVIIITFWQNINDYILNNSSENTAAVLDEISQNMVFVEGGTFVMGSDDSDVYDDEKPAHMVTVSSFYISKYEVTQAQWKAVMGSNNNPSNFRGDNFPVDFTIWEDVQKFIRKLNTQTGKKYRLPTETEWEYAARGGNKSLGYKYSGSNNVDDVAWHMYNSGGWIHPVGTKSPNELGIFDMSGNIAEWCSDCYRSYSNNWPTSYPPNYPQGDCSYRVQRGECYYALAEECRSTIRRFNHIDIQSGSSGFRLAADL